MPLDPAIGGALINTAADIGGGFISRAHQRKQLRRQLKAQRKSADTQWGREQEAWRMNNQYNSPQQQMERLKAAGLNPNMIYGASAPSGASGSQPSAPRQEVADHQSVKPFKIPDGIGTYLDIMMKKATIKNIEADTVAKGTTDEQKRAGQQWWAGNAQQAWEILQNKSHKGEMENFYIQKKLTQEEQGRKIDINTKKAILEGIGIKNKWDKAGIPSSAMETKQAYKVLKAKGWSDLNIAEALLAASVGVAILKNIIPAGILAKALGGKKKP